MKSAEQSGLDSAIASLPSTLQDSVGQWVDRLCDIDDSARDWFDAAPAEKNSLLRLVGSSEFAGRVLLREWSWFTSALSGNGMYRAVGANALQDIIDDLLLNARGEEDLRAQLRRIRNRQLLHVLWRGLNGAATLRKSLHDLSDVADALITAAVRGAEAMLSPRFGLPHDSAGQVIPPVVLAMGKLGGRELNFSSDIDIIFLYRDDGNTDGPKSLSAHEYFTRLSRKVVALLDEVTEDGFVYRVDTRLRPFGDSGPPVTSFAALESYLLQHARGWERYAYVKARVVTPRGDAAIHEELVGGIIEPFVYRQYLDFGVFESLRDMKTMISAEVQRRELAGNIKLGPGGIREIEFITQALQLVRGGRDRALRNPALLDVLPQLANGKGLRRESVDKLMNAYEFLRKLENAVQALKDRQVHETPDDPVDQSRLVLAMDYADWPALQRDFDRHRKMVAAEFAGLLFGAEDDAAPPAAADELAALWGSSASTEQWVAGFARLDFPDPQAMADLIGHFADASIHRQLDRMARRRLARFMPLLLQQLLDRRAGHVVLERVLNVTTQILRRSAYVSLLNENPPVLGRLIDLCENSAYLAGEIARYPVLLDELLDPRVYSTAISVAEMREELADRLRRIDADDSERQIEALGQMQRAFLFRIALSDHSGTLPIMKVSDRLTELAELVLEHALQIAWRDLTRQHGAPVYQAESGAMKAGFAVIAYGKLGGMELSYYSDLDLVFLHDSHGERQETDGPKPLDNSLFFSRLVRRLIHFLTAQTA